MRRVVVTGMGALTPIGNSLTHFWQNALAGKSGAAPIESFDTAHFKTKFACALKGFRSADYFDRKEERKYDLFTQYAVVSADEAIQDSGFMEAAYNADRVGVIWGSGNGGIQSFEEGLRDYHNGDGTPRFSPFFVPRILVDIPAGVISIKHGFLGVNYCPVSACATSTTAIIDAFNYIRWNKADIIVSGGSEAAIVPSTLAGFGAAKALSTKNEAPEKASRPFDINRDGFVMGEGAGALILEEYEHAKKRGAKIYAEVVGGGMAADAYHLTGTHPEGRGAVMGMKLALEEAQIQANEVGYVNMHATSTPQGDVSELKAVQNVFGSGKVAVGGTKSMTGHLLGAAGGIEAILTIKALQENIVPPTINLEEVEPEFDGVFAIPTVATEMKLNYALSNTFGFGGHIASVLFKKFSE
jgi:3-oxoacyl-[acyl-carrier-protein] synthase II